jgi:anti-sigma B factor antagonist
MTLAITVDDRRPPTVLSVGGDLDLNTAPELLQALTRLVDDGRRAVVVDLTGVGFCDSSGLSVLVRVRNRLTELGGSVTLAAATPIVQRVLEVSGLDEIFGMYPSVEAARAAAAGTESGDGPVVGDGGRTGLVE